MKWVKDLTGRFPRRPHYEESEIDYQCEQIIQDFLIGRYGKVTYPIKTSDLTVLIEKAVEDLDMGADFSDEEGEVEGVTEFQRNAKPTVRISKHLVENPIQENRLRTTLTHEYTHVAFHSFMFEVETKPPSLFGDLFQSQGPDTHTNRCKRDNIVSAAITDWMEWQAGYGCGAFLMPISELLRVAKGFRDANKLQVKPIMVSSAEGQELISLVSTTFQTSRDAARVRMLKKKIIEEGSGNENTLFCG